MSRYFQSSYHGSNDYKKYREERLGKNINLSTPSDKKYFPQDSSLRQESRRNTGKEHLQTFGKQTSGEGEEKKNQGKYDDLNKKYKESQKNKREQTSTYESCSFLSKRGFANNLEPTKNQEDKISKYMKDRYGADDRPAFLNEQTLAKKVSPAQDLKIGSRFKGNSIDHQRYSRNYDTEKDGLSSDSFEDSIITRRKNYEHLNGAISQDLRIPSKTYNYSGKIKNQGDEGFDFKPAQPKQRGLIKDITFEDKYRTNPGLIAQISSTSPYKSRNQMIKQRLNLIKKENEQDTSFRGFKREFAPLEESTKGCQTKRQFIYSQIKTTQITPQKQPLSVRDDRNASEQRRKSLIEKSQMLKEKLSRLNSSSNTKAVENQESKLIEKVGEKQNIAQNYTPKRYITNSFRANFDESQKKDKSVSKKLNFDESMNNAEPLKAKKYSTNSVSKSTTPIGFKESFKSQTTGEGALKKISELNERINSKLESILKNYG